MVKRATEKRQRKFGPQKNGQRKNGQPVKRATEIWANTRKNGQRKTGQPVTGKSFWKTQDTMSDNNDRISECFLSEGSR